MMIETANAVINGANVVTIQGLLALITVYALWRMHGFEKKHDREFKELRDEHKAEREKIQAHTNAALDKIAIEIAAANKERQEIKELVKSVMSVNINTERALHDLSMFVGAKCELKQPKAPRTNLNNWQGGFNENN